MQMKDYFEDTGATRNEPREKEKFKKFQLNRQLELTSAVTLDFVLFLLFLINFFFNLPPHS